MPDSPNEILRLEGVWRRYRRWHRRPTSLKEAVVRYFRRGGLAYEDFWALRDISFSVSRGEVVGFCGSNGSGKSTLLRTIAHILAPSRGRVTVRGRIASLLQVATGFHPEFTGRENITLNGMLMGFSEAEIAGHTDAIIEYAELGDFIDSPVKTYSAGMYMRLGFAIAAQMRPDILLLDEVLAVGDAAFQKKCADWFKTVRAAGVTVLIVSHDLTALAEICDRVLWLEKGAIRMQGSPTSVVRQYFWTHVEPHPELVAAEAAAAQGQSS
jgi:lipopolysaccharide transport system ATP-binding protein